MRCTHNWTVTSECPKCLRQELEWYKHRCAMMQAMQVYMRDPERTMVCDILANGKLLHNDPAHQRYRIKD